jgi:hypothetical protein
MCFGRGSCSDRRFQRSSYRRIFSKCLGYGSSRGHKRCARVGGRECKGGSVSYGWCKCNRGR